MIFVYQCIKRSRIAKHSVVERLLTKKISDGHWTLADKSKATLQDLAPAIDLLKCCRERLERLEVKRCIGTEMLLGYFPELVVRYDYSRGIHCVEFHVQQQTE